MADPLYPAEIQRNDQGVMRISWSDGHQSRYPYAQLRQACPCATCRELRAEQQHTRPKDPFQVVTTVTTRAVEPVRLNPVGNYALNIEWNDGHHTGIYPWGMLRALCPCPQCSAEPQP